MRFTAFVLAAAVALLSQPAVAALDRAVPGHIDPNDRYLFFIHNLYVEKHGPHKATKYFDILKAFEEKGFTVISDLRTGKTDPAAFAKTVAGQVEKLRKAGVPDKNIIITGHSKGGHIVLHVAKKLDAPDIRYVAMAGCSLTRFFKKDPVPRHGHFLSIMDTGDTIARSCRPLLKKAGPTLKSEELLIPAAQNHQLFFKPQSIWVDPIVRWINGKAR